MKPKIRAIAWLILMLVALPAWSAPKPPELMLEGEFLSPSSTLEIRFSQTMITPEQVGTTPEPSPLVFQPAIPGKFTWLSRRSGVFVPSAAPKMGTTFSVTLAPGLKDAEQQAVGFKATIKTPAFGISHNPDEGSLSPLPELKIGFNRDVKLEGAAALFRLVSTDGKSVGVTVRYATGRDYFRMSEEAGDWERRWQRALHPESKSAANDNEDEASDEPLRNQLILTAESALTPGMVWQLEMKPGLEAFADKMRITQGRILPLGAVEPFSVSLLETHSYLNSGKSVIVRFSQSVAPDITTENASKFLKIKPEVKNLRVERDWEGLTIRGDFARDLDYQLNLEPTLVSESGLELDGARTFPFRFGPVKPRVYLPEITGHQLLGGRRKFPAHSVNLKALRVVVRQVDPDKTAQAVQAFAAYDKEYDQNAPEEHYQALPAGAVTGKVIYDRELSLSDPQLDILQETILDWTEILGGQKAGTLFLTLEGVPIKGMKGKPPGAQALIQLTDLGVLWKKVGNELQTTVFSMATGKPVKGATATLLDKTFAVQAKAESKPDGTATLPISGEPGWLVVRHGEDVHALAMGDQELPMAAFGISINYSSWDSQEPDSLPIRALLFTERPLYRPGDTVHFKAILRTAAPDGLTPLANKQGKLKVTPPSGADDIFLDFTTDANGSFDCELPLDNSIGSYFAAIQLPGRENDSWHYGFRTSFRVADFQPNAFELTLQSAERFAPAQPVTFQLAAKYFFGSTLGKSPVRWTLQYRSDLFTPEGFESYRFGGGNEPEQKALTLRGESTLSEAGTYTLEPKLPEPTGGPFEGVLTMEVTDLNQQTVAEARTFKRDASAFYLGLKEPGKYVFGVGESVPVRAIALQPGGTPVAQPVEVKVELVRVHNRTVRMQGAGKSIRFRTEREEEVLVAEQKQTLVPVRVGASWLLPDAETTHFTTDKIGDYLVRVSAKDAAGKSTMASFNFEVGGPESISWDYRNPAQVDLVPDKAQYRPGETARIMIKTPISGEALVSVERESKILRTQRIQLEGNAPMIEIPVEASDAPNVFVSMIIIRGADASTRKFKVPEYRYGACQLNVADPATDLRVAITPQSPTVLPGQEVINVIQIKDGNGAVVPDANVTFFAVDEGILAITGYDRPEPRPIFEAPFSLAIRTGITLYELLPEDPGSLEFGNKGYLIGGGGSGGPAPGLRTNFPGTACWFANLKTDPSGKVTVKFPAPDALTRYRLVAVAHAGANRFGSGESSFQIRKNFLILSALGQGANVGDQILARAVVRNESGADGKVDLALTLDSTAEPADATPLSAQFALKNGESRAVDFPVKLRAMGQATWKWTGQLISNGQKSEDGLVASLKIGSPVPLLRETYLAETSAEQLNLLTDVNPQLLEGTGSLKVTLANTRLAALRETARELLQYPYGCAEQTVSSLMPWIAYEDLAPVLPDLLKETERKDAIRDGIKKIFALQTPEGGLGYWPGSREPSLFASAYAVLALSVLEKQGQKLPPQQWKSLLDYVSGALRENKPARIEEMALAAFALASADKAEPAYHENLYALREKLSLEGRALLACAIMQARGKPAMVEKLLAPASNAPANESWFGSATRERAIRLMAWSQFKSTDREVGRLVKELLASRRNGHWRTTQENAWAMLALSRYFKEVERTVTPVAGSLVRSAVATPFSLTRKELSQSQQYTFDSTAPLDSLELQNPEKKPVYTEANFVVRPRVSEQPRQNRGYAVSRSYQKLATDGSLQGTENWQVGDRILVTLRLETSQPGHFVAIDDPLPAILEAINPEFRSQGSEAGTDQSSVSDYREIRSDRILYFCDHLRAGTFTFRYLARVRSAGKVTAPAVKVEEMYRPERFGLSETGRLESKPAAQ